MSQASTVDYISDKYKCDISNIPIGIHVGNNKEHDEDIVVVLVYGGYCLMGVINVVIKCRSRADNVDIFLRWFLPSSKHVCGPVRNECHEWMK